jgi:large subunit ribosomal protein L9
LEKRNNSDALKQKIQNEKITITVPAGEKGRLYGTVTTANIAEELHKLNYDIDRKKIELKEHIKFGGTYKFTIHLYQDVNATVELIVVAKQEQKQQERKTKGRRGQRNYKKEETKEQAQTENMVNEEEKTQEISE